MAPADDLAGRAERTGAEADGGHGDCVGQTDDLGPIVRKVDTSFSTINGKYSSYFSAFLLAPIDAKFPQEDYQRLQAAQEAGDLLAAELAGKALEARVKTSVKPAAAPGR